MKTIVITGATSGIGYEAAKVLASMQHHIIIVARNEAKARVALASISTETNNTHLDYVLADFASLSSVAAAAKQIREQFASVDVLLNNAGVWEMERKTSAQGYEINFAVNHLAPFLFTLELLPALRKSAHARIVNTSSMAHRRNILHLDDLNFTERPYDGVATYSQSKLCNLLFTLQLQEFLNGSGISANSVHPGYVKTSLFDQMGHRDWANVPNASEGARASIFASIDPSLEGISGQFFFKEQIETPTAMAMDKALAVQLWDKSLAMVKPFLSLNA
jgi:NAD(P)-dependent dehydrogenase (short-subunit alcohol dehydrogenase family)